MSETDETDFPNLESSDSRPNVAAGPESESLAAMNSPPRGMRRADEDGRELIDAMAGRASVFGFGFEPITDAIQAAAESYLGDASAFGDLGETDSDHAPLKQGLLELLGDSRSITVDSVFLCPSADTAVEKAIALARTHRPDKAFRTVAMVGADHGRTGMCRTASGRPELQEGFGPMMAGFAHVPLGDLDAVRAVVDEQTACILLAPIDLHNAGRPCDAEFLTGIREICDQRDVLLVIDETQLAFGSSGRPLAFSAIAPFRADLVALSGGLFAGLAGGIVLASHRCTGNTAGNGKDHPLLAAVATETLTSMLARGLPASASDAMRGFAVALAEKLNHFEFVRDVHVLGMTIGIELDITSSEVTEAARGQGLRVEAAGDTGIRIQPPLVVSDEDQQLLLERLAATMEVIEREASPLSI